MTGYVLHSYVEKAITTFYSYNINHIQYDPSWNVNIYNIRLSYFKEYYKRQLLESYAK